MAGKKTPGVVPPTAPMQANESPRADEVSAPQMVVRRPDGYYWREAEGGQEFGPFASVEEARADIAAYGEDFPEPGETLQEAESELGISDWIDPDTGELAEGLSPPHIDEM